MKSWTKLLVIALMAAVAIGCAPAANNAGGNAEEPAADAPAEEAAAEAPAEEVAAAEEPAEEMAAAEEAPEEGSAPEEAPATEEAAAEGGDDALAAMMSEWVTAFGALDLEKATANYADDYEDAESGSKEEYLAWIGGIVDQGFLEGLTISDEDAEIEVDGEEATAGPYDIESDAGGWTLDVYLEKREGAWKITSTDVY